MKALWNYEAPAGGGDTHHAVFRGTLSRVEVRQAEQSEKYTVDLLELVVADELLVEEVSIDGMCGVY